MLNGVHGLYCVKAALVSSYFTGMLNTYSGVDSVDEKQRVKIVIDARASVFNSIKNASANKGIYY